MTVVVFMPIELATLSIHEALKKSGIKNYDHLPKMIGTSGVALVLSDNRDCYYTTTRYGCSCDESISGISPCSHQAKYFEKVVLQEPESENERQLEHRLWLKKTLESFVTKTESLRLERGHLQSLSVEERKELNLILDDLDDYNYRLKKKDDIVLRHIRDD